ncbi:hypothetical protein CLV59_10121 [Chitinophaga dinghuensis]|uniref:Uncharacterized protein n=1 Tax=Chitinophaga dinghuensis TaxID=1539050 RepID=A0A327WBR4_9BACT|nr:hypothetical protein [Chitinophaga dinghuensis]RAJ87272.1 hypothetical protein CLV59_10121 [Chitinophaga dinghuensis]
MRKWIIALAGLLGGCAYHSSDFRTTPDALTEEEIALLKKDLQTNITQYDAGQKMIWTVTKEKHYHSDLDSGVKVHDTRGSIQYAAALFHTQDSAAIQRGISIVKAILPLQEKDTGVAYCGVWPYYPEDLLKGRKAPVDYNWADFISVALIDIVRNGSAQLDDTLKAQIKESLILAARSIMKRNVKADYTNICIMGTYVCYAVGNLYEQTDIRQYGQHKLAYFYDYTNNSKGFTEYNSPTYTIVAMNELLRMKQAIVNPLDKKMVDELYDRCWQMIARHFHAPSGQWCGPNLRAYNDLLTPELKQLFFYASKGQVNLPGDYPREARVLEPHEMPASLIPLFLHQDLPRIAIDTFMMGAFQLRNTDGLLKAKDIIGKLYAHPQYALASVNQGYLWNQCRPLIADWGTAEKPSYLRVRFLHDLYDFAAVHIKNAQDSSTVLSILNIAWNGGDKHPTIDRIKDSTITASDLRLRIETGGDIDASVFSITGLHKNELQFTAGALHMVIQVPYCNWNGLEGHWETGGDASKKWADYVIHTGGKKTFNLAAMKEAVIGLSVSMRAKEDIQVRTDEKYLHLSTKGLSVQALKKPDDEFRIKNDFETDSK